MRAAARHIRISPRKARQAVDLIRGKDVPYALSVLQFTPKKAAGIVRKVVQSASANASRVRKLSPSSLYVARAFVDQGPSLKRWVPRAYGRATPIKKRTSHITVILEEKGKPYQPPAFKKIQRKIQREESKKK